MENSKQNSPIILVGMGRSGTSYTSSLLHYSGINMGEKLLEANYWNEQGYFEDVRFFDFHVKWLCKFNLDHSFGVPSEEQLSNTELYEDALNLIKDIKENTQWGFKDPRSTGFLPLWKKIFPNALFVLLYRNPLDVADSLIKRAESIASKEPIQIIKIWNQYNEIAIRELKNCKFICRNINQIISDPSRFIDEVSSYGYNVTKNTLDKIFVKESFSSHIEQYPDFTNELLNSWESIKTTYTKLNLLADYQHNNQKICDTEFLFKTWLDGRNLVNYKRLIEEKDKAINLEQEKNKSLLEEIDLLKSELNKNINNQKFDSQFFSLRHIGKNAIKTIKSKISQ